MQGFAPADEVLLFRQKAQNHFRPYGPYTPSASIPNQDGEGTRSAQTTLAEKSIRYRGSAALEGEQKLKKHIQFSYSGNGNPILPKTRYS